MTKAQITHEEKNPSMGSVIKMPRCLEASMLAAAVATNAPLAEWIAG